jgi:hypothetical protein
MRKVGKVINIEKSKVHIITTKREFVTVKKHATEPILGELYAGEEFQKNTLWKYLLALTFMLLLLISIRKLYLNNKYNFSVIVDMNCSMKLEVSGSNKVKKVEGISTGGYKIKQLMVLEHKPLNEALRLILDESIKQKYLTKAHADDGFKISIFVSDNRNNIAINLTEFEEYANKHKFKVIVNNSEQSAIK